MSWGRVVVLDPELGTEIPKLRIVELLPIVRHQGSWDTKPANYGAPNEVAYLLFYDSSQRFSFDPFGEIIYCYDDKFVLALSNGQRSQYDLPLLLKRPGACN